MLRNLVFALLISLLSTSLFAVEGMWLPILLEKYNIEQMQEKGFKLTAEDIYSINQASLKDAVVGLISVKSPFRNFCSGELISDQGLFITNHHCGYRQIQSHSSVENDYLTNGFWAMSKEEELPNEGMGIALFKRMEDVTSQVLDGLSSIEDDVERDSILDQRIEDLEKSAVEGTHYKAKISPFFGGNEYYMTVIEVYEDIRLVGAPPSAIGKFGGDTDNWMWPRHTGDFSMFRIYADKENEPAEFSDENIPYVPERFFEISLEGVEKDDFTMVLGYPGTTTEYLPSYAVALETQVVNPIRISVRGEALNIMDQAMDQDAKVRIQYSAKAASKANGWKKWIGENRGLKRLHAIEKKQQLEKDFQVWVELDAERNKEYGDLISTYEKLYTDIEPYRFAATYFWETVMSIELIDFASDFHKLNKFDKDTDVELIKTQVESIQKKADKFFKDYDKATDIALFNKLLSIYYNEVPADLQPESFQNIAKKYKGNSEGYVAAIYEKTMFCDADQVQSFLDDFSLSSLKKLKKDPVFALTLELFPIYNNNIAPTLNQLYPEITKVDKQFIKALREFKSETNFYPDANSTFRISYGNIDDYTPKDGVYYDYRTTLQGIIEKDNPDIYDYRVPGKLKELYEAKDYGDYANANGTMPVCFTASNHTTGGNSGSPVLNANGALIGINFDRNWEGTMSDIMYDPDMCRNIILDIRYALFLIDKYAGATHLINEMSFSKTADEELIQETSVEEVLLEE